MKKGLKKKKKSEEDQGFLDKLAIKIIDNIQLTITNIHFRWEHNNEESHHLCTFFFYIFLQL